MGYIYQYTRYFQVQAIIYYMPFKWALSSEKSNIERKLSGIYSPPHLGKIKLLKKISSSTLSSSQQFTQRAWRILIYLSAIFSHHHIHYNIVLNES